MFFRRRNLNIIVNRCAIGECSNVRTGRKNENRHSIAIDKDRNIRSDNLNVYIDCIRVEVYMFLDFGTRRLDIVVNCGRIDRVKYIGSRPVSYTHLRAHETPEHLVCRLLLEKKKKKHTQPTQ